MTGDPYEPPAGFFRVLDRTGKDCGLGHYCPTCKITWFNLSSKRDDKLCKHVPSTQSFFRRLIEPLEQLPGYCPNPNRTRTGTSVIVEV